MLSTNLFKFNTTIMNINGEELNNNGRYNLAACELQVFAGLRREIQIIAMTNSSLLYETQLLGFFGRIKLIFHQSKLECQTNILVSR